MPSKRSLHRSIEERWVVKGTMVLISPAHFGGRSPDPWMNIHLLMDEFSDQPLLSGTSIAGALRNYLLERMLGYVREDNSEVTVSRLFGSRRRSRENEPSSLIVFDSVSEKFGFELRDGVTVDADARTAADIRMYNLQLLAAGSEFPLQFELLVNRDGQELREALVTALNGLESGEITLGARKRRGFGQVTVRNWHVWKYDLRKKDSLLAWLASERDWQPIMPEQEGDNLAEKLEIFPGTQDQRQLAHLEAIFAIDGTLMIRSGFGESDDGADIVHLHSRHLGDQSRPVIPGTSWSGILRSRALKIARTVSGNRMAASQAFVDEMFGPSASKRKEKSDKASRVSIRETEIEHSSTLVVTRAKLDRFTGGSFEDSLFSERPIIGTAKTQLTLHLSLRNPKQAEIGLLLLLLKDLWTGDLPVGGQSGIGRGRLKGIRATLTTAYGEWKFTSVGEKIHVDPSSEQLEQFVDAFNNELRIAQVGP